MDTVDSQPRPAIAPSSTGLANPRTRRTWQVVALGLAILICGMVIGAGGALIYVKHRVLHAIHHPEEAPARITNRIKAKLNLTEDQAAKVKTIVTERHRAIMAIRRESRPNLLKELEKAKGQIAAILTPDQASAWNKRFEELRRRWIPTLPPEPK